MEASKYFIRKSVIAYKNMFHGSGDRYVLLEDVLKLGNATDPEINTKFLKFYQDTTLQTLIADTETRFADMSDLNKELNTSFTKLKRWFPDMEVPKVYAQISALDQSIVVGNQSIGISLDKYLGSDYPLYAMYYDENQRVSMSQEYIVPDVLVFYLISHYPLSNFEVATPEERDTHMGRVMYVANQLMNRQFFDTGQVSAAARLVKSEGMSLQELLRAQ